MNGVSASTSAGVDQIRDLPLKHLALTVLAIGILCGIPSVALESSTHIASIDAKMSAAAAAIESDDSNTANLNAIVDNTAHTDIEPQSVFPHATIQYLLMQQTQHHLVRASEAFEQENYKEAATEMRKASSYMRLEAASTTGDAREELHTTIAKLDELATAVH